jgi:hypothetical protein
MTRGIVFLFFTLVAVLQGCAKIPTEATQALVQEAPPPEPGPRPIPPPPALVDVLPEFKRTSRAFLDFARKLDELAAVNPPPSYQSYWRDSVPLDEIYANVISNEPKFGAGANAFERINKLRDSLFKTQLILKNTDELRASKVIQLLETEAAKRKPFFDEAEFFWKQTPEKTDMKDILNQQLKG